MTTFFSGTSTIFVTLLLLVSTATAQSRGNEQTNFDATFSHHIAEVNGIRLHYVRGGKGEPLVLLHGFPETWHTWRKVMPALAERYTVIAPDMRGMGDSSKPAGGYDKRTVAEDIYQLTQQLGFERINVVGQDLGATVAFMLAATHPESVRRLAFLESVLPGFGWERGMDNSKGIGIWHFSFFAVHDLPEALAAGKERLLVTEFIRELATNADAINDQDLDVYVRAYSAPGALRAAFGYYRAFLDDAKQTKQYAARKLQMPVLALGGENNLGLKVRDEMQNVAADVRGGVIERCGHWLQEERPEELTRQFLNFFGEATAATGTTRK